MTNGNATNLFVGFQMHCVIKKLRLNLFTDCKERGSICGLSRRPDNEFTREHMFTEIPELFTTSD